MSGLKRPDAPTLEQLVQHGYDGQSRVSGRPLLVCDVDEVVLHLVDPFERVMNERGFELRAHAFQLTGNIFDKETGREATQAEVWAGLEQLFEEQADRQGIVDNVVEGLTSLNDHVDIVFLTNLPHVFGETRRDYLKASGLAQPLITNAGSKAPALRMLAAGHTGPTGFIDDSPLNIRQVREALPDIRLFHFMANERFRTMLDELEGPLHHGSDWLETWPVIRDHLTA